ncbi:hypothetical protein ACQKWADRAFT_293277 [Trichoderma austrokoningii]
MTAMRGPRLQVGSATWIGEERASALEIVQAEVEEFSYSAHNEIEWLNEHMAAILNENEVNITEVFKTPGKLRGKTPNTARKANAIESRVPLSDVFAAASPGIPKNHIPAQTGRTHPPPQLHQVASKTVPIARAASPQRHVFSPQRPPPTRGMQDSGYYGSQDFAATDPSDEGEPEELEEAEELASPYSDIVLPPGGSSIRRNPARNPAPISPTKTFQTTREDLSARALPNIPSNATTKDEPESPSKESDVDEPYFEAAIRSPAPSPRKLPMPPKQSDEASEDDHSASEGSSPIRPVVRKSSLNFASLPAREPLNSGKSLGARQSQNSHRTSYYQRQTGGKSLGNLARRDLVEEDNSGGVEVDGKDLPPVPDASEAERLGMNHTKTYTQRLQDQISMLGKPQGSFGQTKQTPNASVAQQNTIQMQSVASPRQTSPEKEPISTTPRASPGDDDDDWIGPPTAVKDNTDIRPLLTKSHTADIMEGLLDKADDDSPQANEETPHGFFHHSKTMSFSNAPTASAAFMRETVPLSKAISTSSLVASQDDMAETPSKSLPRNFRDSPLKQVKNKLSSILKGSRGLLASNADAKSLMSPSVTRLALHAGQSSESVLMRPQDIEYQPTEPTSPTKPVARRTRASTEREKEQKRRDNELKRMEEQMDKLDKAREKEREKARAFTQEQEKVATMEKEVASRKQQDERLANKATPNPVKRSQSSPRRMRAGEEPEWRQADRDTDMSDAQPPMPPPSSTKPTLAGQAARGKDNKRPVKPTKDLTAKAKAPPTVIRVNTGSQHSQYVPAGSRVSAASHDTLNSTNSTVSSKTSKSSYQAKSATQTFKTPASSGRSKAVELAARKREQDEKESQRRRDAKAEMERKRIAAQEEQRKQDQQRRLELERQRQQEEEKKSAQRQAAIEKAKQTRAPPPAARSQPNGPPDATLGQPKSKADGQPARPPSRLAGMRDDSGRPFNSMLSNAAKAGAKRTLGTETNDSNYSRPPPSRGGPAYQTKDSKRRRTSEHEDDELGAENPPNIKGPPVRPSTGFKKDLPSKSAFQTGYGAAPHSVTRDLFKAAVTAQHNSHMKAAHPLDMAQISKGPIPFAPSSSNAAAAGAAGPSFKTPARPGQLVNPKSSVKRSSPRLHTGDSIELPEIQTDDEDDDDDSHGMNVAAWADSPDLRQALMRQETMDPSRIFGPPAPLIMEEVFSKSKDKWHKFRQRTSSANWSGLDRLTEDDIRKDMVARNKLRRDGGWSYEMSKDML